jgi:uridylate kinase
MFSRAEKRQYIVVSVGGSLIVPEGIDTSFLQSFRECILDHVRRGFSFFIIAGGGRTSRAYQDAAHAVRGDLDRDDLDWIGIHSTRLNAHLLRALFKEEAQERIVKNPTRALHGRAPLIIGAGWRPGWSTDYIAVMAAKKLGTTKLVNLSDIDHVYTKDPEEFPDAEKLEQVDWKTFRSIIPDHWDPGLSTPFDPIAAKEAEALSLEVAVMNGRDLNSFENYLAGKPFIGTVIK